MSFSGSRLDDVTDQFDDYNPKDNGNFTVIALNTSDPKVPTFMFANGSKFEFQNHPDGWDAELVTNSTSLAPREVKATGVQWVLLSLMAAVGGFVLFS
jgi:hypothetical protein